MKLIHLVSLLTVTSLVGVSSVIGADKPAKKKPLSPPAVATANIDGNKIEINYSQPYIRNPKTGEPRVIWGGLVPYGEVWRTGANAATTISLEKPIVIGGYDLAAGKYTLFTVPTESGAGSKLIINKRTGEWGIPYKEAEEKPNELARVDMTRGQTTSKVDPFTISIEQTGPGAGQIKFAWADAYYAVDFKNKE